MTKKTLQAWYNEGSIYSNQKQIINNFGVSDYHSDELGNFKKIYYFNDILIRNSNQLEKFFDNEPIRYMLFFSTDWNNNLILVVSSNIGESSFTIILIAYEMPHEQMREIFEVFIVGYNSSLSAAKNRTLTIKNNLRNSENPILCLMTEKDLEINYHDDYNNWFFPVRYGFSMANEEIKRIEVDFNAAEKDPDKHFKPLDIVMIFNSEWVHTCIYLGNKQICHARPGNRVMIEDWKKFLFEPITPYKKKMLRYHPVIAFKKPNEIIKHIANCVEKQETYFSSEKKGNFDIEKNNCENFTNRCVFGLNFSELAERRKKDRGGVPKMELNVVESLNNTKRDLDNLTSYTPTYTINKIRECRRVGGYEIPNVNRDGINMYDAYIEVQPKATIFKEMINEYIARQRY